MEEIMGSQAKTGSGSENRFGRVARLRGETAARVEQLRSQTLGRLFQGKQQEEEQRAVPNAGQLALPPAEHDDDVIEAELVEDADVTPAYGRSGHALAEDDQTHRDYMELFSMTDPEAARRKLAEIQQRERERLQSRTRSGLAAAALVPTTRRR
jgi:hypothetical protein